jgi:GNAT superfamily N-acetyltransferase
VVVFDEFTSVVDRSVAKVCSAALAKGIRARQLPCRFVAVTCHYDVAEWLQPDWMVDLARGELTRRRLRRPAIELEIRRCPRSVWRLFERHHYLSGALARGARCYLATWKGTPVNFCATVPLVGRRGHRRFTRIVTLPDYQGIGIGLGSVGAVARLHRAEGLRVSVTSSHPAVVRHCARSARWKITRAPTWRSRGRPGAVFSHYRDAMERAVVSFEYVGE